MSKELRYNEPWILQRADPYVYRHTDGNYYFTASVPAYDRIVLRKSKTLAGIVIEARLEQPEKAPSPIVVIPEDMYTSVR